MHGATGRELRRLTCSLLSLTSVPFACISRIRRRRLDKFLILWRMIVTACDSSCPLLSEASVPSAVPTSPAAAFVSLSLKLVRLFPVIALGVDTRYKRCSLRFEESRAETAKPCALCSGVLWLLARKVGKIASNISVRCRGSDSMISANLAATNVPYMLYMLYCASTAEAPESQNCPIFVSDHSTIRAPFLSCRVVNIPNQSVNFSLLPTSIPFSNTYQLTLGFHHIQPHIFL